MPHNAVKKARRLVLVSILAAVWAAPLTASPEISTRTIILSEDIDYTLAGDDFEYKIIAGDAGFDFVRESQGWQGATGAGLNFGMIEGTVWLRFSVRNLNDKPVAWSIYYSDPLVNELDLITVQPDGTYSEVKTGTMRPFVSRPRPHHAFVFPSKNSSFGDRCLLFPNKIGECSRYKFEPCRRKKFFIRYRNEFALLCIYYGLIGVMFFYNIFLYGSTRDKGYLLYILYLAAFGLLTASLNGFANQFLWPGWPWFSNHSIAVFLELTLVFLVQFIRVFVETARLRPILDRVFVWSAAVHLFVGFFHILFMETVWLTNLFVASLVPVVGSGVVLLISILMKFGTRPAIFTTAAFAVFLLGITLGIFRFMGLLPDNAVTRNSMLAGSAVEIVVLALGLADRINRMRSGLIEAESKYRHIVEGATEIIFTLDEEFKVTNINSAVRRLIGYSPEDVLGKEFTELIQEYDRKQTPVTQRVIRTILNRLVENRKGVTFIAPLKRKHAVEPVQLSIRLDWIEFENTLELFGRAAIRDEDLNVTFLASEKVAYKVTNLLNNAETISRRLTQALRNRMDEAEVSVLRICLREMIINAIEHGNLEISFEQKSKLLADESYMDFLKEKMHDPKYSGRQVHIEYVLSQAKVAYRITDEGTGFNHREIVGKSDKVNEGLVAHGRGIAMTREVFDRVTYNEKGNRVTLIKYFHERVV